MKGTAVAREPRSLEQLLGKEDRRCTYNTEGVAKNLGTLEQPDQANRFAT